MTAVNFGEQLFHAVDDSDQDQPTWRQAPSLLGAVERAEPFDHQWAMGSVATMLLLETIWMVVVSPGEIANLKGRCSAGVASHVGMLNEPR